MRHPSPLSNVLKTALVTVVPSTLLLVMPARGIAQVVVPLGHFRSVTLRNGGEVTLRHASDQRVTLIKGTANYTRATIVDGDRLVIDRPHGRRPKGYELAVEILTPDIHDITVMDGGTIESRGDFPRQAELRVAVANGGTIDLRSMTVDQVTATVREGGRILARPQETLITTIASGGEVTYWGNPRVTSSVENGGIVSRGPAADADRPLLEFGPASPALPPVPLVPPVPPTRARRTFSF